MKGVCLIELFVMGKWKLVLPANAVLDRWCMALTLRSRLVGATYVPGEYPSHLDGRGKKKENEHVACFGASVAVAECLLVRADAAAVFFFLRNR